MDLAREQIARGHQVGLIADSLTGGLMAEQRLGELEPHLALGLMRLPIHRLPHISDLSAMAAVNRRIAETAPDVVHGHGSKGGAYARAISLFPGRGRAIRAYTPHGGSLHFQPGMKSHRPFMLAERLMSRRTDILLFESAFVASRFHQYVGQPHGLERVIPNGISSPEFQPVAPHADAADLLYVGEFRMAAKGLDTLIDALGLLAREEVRPSLVLVGDGPETQSLVERAVHAGVGSQVTMRPRMPAREAFALGKIMVTPSRFESLPYIVLEAAGAMLPLVATNVGGVSEIYGPYADRLIACDNPQLLAGAIREALSETAERRRAKAAALHDYVASRFTIGRMVERVLEGYRAAIASRARGAPQISLSANAKRIHSEAAPTFVPSKMRICHVIESSSGGSSRVVVDLLRDQLHAGHEVTLIYSPVRAEQQFTDALAAIGDRLRVRTVSMSRAVRPHDIVSAWTLLRELRELGPFDVVHAHSSKAGALSRLAGIFLSKTVIVYTPHAFVTLAPEAARIFGVAEWAASWFCDAILLGSQQELTHARDALHLPVSRLRLIPPGVDLSVVSDRATARNTLGLPDDAFVVGFVGRMAPQKNPLRLAEVLGIVAGARPDLRFVVVGDGELFDLFSTALRAQGAAAATTFAPDVDGREVMAAFDCLVCASDYESFGLIFPEALAAGVPIVSPPVGVAPEAIVTGKTGALTSFEPDDIARGVLEIAAKSAKDRETMTKACRDMAPKFDASESGAQIRALYQELLIAKIGAAPDHLP
ncbi:MAG: hypothetical protein CTY15_12720 [Methylocystis sp.]|nr:MAG: hypothetical protein CTY15_12720 [Methylocystis sp.]